MAELTPMMRQYLEIKKDNPDSILFFRLGDFYEMFDEDARTASRELDLTLTSRDHGKHAKPAEERIPMCGIPYHASEAYIARLIAKGYKVAICEQMEDPATAKGLVKRDIIRVITPGTVTDAACLDDKSSNFLCGIYLDERSAAAAFCDVTTGKAHLTAFSGDERVEHIINELGRFSPAEAILNDGAWAESRLLETLREKFHCRVERGGERRFLLADAEKSIRRQFGEEALKRLPAGNPAAAMAIGGLLSYLYETQKTDLSHINDLDYYEQGVFLELDLTARRNLELTETLRNKEKKGSLLWVLDKTKTPMGGRCLRSWLERPLLSVTAINRRSSAVAALVEATIAREELSAAMTGLGDMERLLGRIVYGTAGGRDMASLRAAMERLPEIKAQLASVKDRRLGELAAELDVLEDLRDRIARTICDEPPFSVREGGFIRDGFDQEVDRLRHILQGGKGVIPEMEAREKEKTGIRTLKIGYNKVFGYYIEVSNSFKDQVPDTYIRKQTLVNGERFITQELKDLEHEILTASERVVALEYQLFTALREEISAAAVRIQKTAAAVAELDALVSFAAVAVRNNYCRPDVDESGVIEIQEGRHPVVERVLKDSLFVPNHTFMGEKEERVAIITGPNMAGKSTYMRQVALIVLMAQMGSFVPAAHAHIGVVDRIFTRIGASDDLSAGQSTFMVEMTEVSDILHHATKNSLLILDEIGRGTSTYDGMSIARAVLEYCAEKKRAKTLFATHYHELTELENSLPGTVNYNIAVKARGEEIIFLRKIVPGGADRSYGIEVARLAGLPEKVVQRAKAILKELEAENGVQYVAARRESDQMTLGALGEGEVLDAIRRCQPDTLTPIEAMSLIYEWKQKLQ
ncbi:DNA mismatch repair protein MutS [Pusillibacter faecalis]|uniref:DNA mismatch repair protein MutS n=1 Tax=Pusillibacter faecalis TaxID=2714358 RepID=A0A810QD57_9FIRM|nr:DNA mismatch repair protein MutS [Pusillibacter faecalis]MBS5657307.1 DNA mismatch repair protein MutS [Oscillibacter sp.]BCK84177.1 DNA mismatch repair protein MutS [Pusillibacter faecalis]